VYTLTVVPLKVAGPKGYPLVSIIILNYNAVSFLKNCFDSVLNSTYPNIEIVFVDNASTDGSVDFIKSNYGHLQKLKFVLNNQNLGFNEGNNVGFAQSNGEFCVFMNPDAKINDPSTIEKIVQVLLVRKTVGIIAPVLLNYDSDIVQSAGVYQSFRPFEYGKGEHYKAFIEKNPVLFPIAVTPGAFVLIRRSMAEKIGLFDKVFFMQGDIDDLSFRAWKKGYTVAILPTVTVMHYEGGSVKHDFVTNNQRVLRIYYHGIRADFAVILKNFDPQTVLKFWSLRLLIYFIETSLISLKYKKPYSLMAYFMGIWWNVRQFKSMYSKRKRLRQDHLCSDRDIMPYILGNCGASNYIMRFRQFRS
jgi:GT2 family glycosyltransferase